MEQIYVSVDHFSINIVFFYLVSSVNVQFELLYVCTPFSQPLLLLPLLFM